MTDHAAPKKLPFEITTYDLIKSFAVIIMVIDHVGYYFFPDQLWFRAVGRVGFPVWFFLVGYASGRDVPAKLLGGAVILLAANMITGMPLLPLNALVTIIMIRLTIDYIMLPVMQEKISIWAISAVLFVLILPSYVVTEYGTQAIITAMFGYLVRHRAQVHRDLVLYYMFFALISFVLIQQILFQFDPAQLAVVILGTALIRSLLYNFKPVTLPRLTAHTPWLLKFPIQVMGRRTLEIYVIHLIIFKCIALYLGDDRFELFRITLT